MKTKLNSLIVGLFLSLFIIYPTSCSSDDPQPEGINTEEIIGDWTFENSNVVVTINDIPFIEYQIQVNGLTEEDAKLKTSLIELLYKIRGTISIKDDKTFSAVMNDKVKSGKWYIGDPQYHLFLNSKIDPYITEIITLTNNKLEIKEEFINITYNVDGTKTEQVAIVNHILTK